jgi:hypothetical protein
MDVIDYEIFGGDIQYVEIELDPGEVAIGEAGSMMMMQDGIQMDTVFGDGSSQSAQGGLLGKLMGAGKRLLTGESLFTTILGIRNPKMCPRSRIGSQRTGVKSPWDTHTLKTAMRPVKGTARACLLSNLATTENKSIPIICQTRENVKNGTQTTPCYPHRAHRACGRISGNLARTTSATSTSQVFVAKVS